MCIRDRYDANGIGLAATQVDEHIRLVVMDLSEDRNEPMVFVNPEYKVQKEHKLVEFEEGCLSIPGFNHNIARPDNIELKWQDLKGKIHEIKPEGMLSICIQHEIDHLDGITFDQHVSPMVWKEAVEKAKFVDKTFEWSRSDNIRPRNKRSSK